MRAQASPGTEQEGNWYVPVIGMGAGSVIGGGMKALQQTWADTLRLLSGRSALPTTENITTLAGGITGSPQSTAGVKALHMPMRVAEPEGTSYGRTGLAAWNDGMRPIKAKEFMPPSMPSHKYVELSGGDIPDKAVWDRVMNSGLRDELLGFGK